MRHCERGKKRIAVIGSKGLPSTASGLEVYVEMLTTAMTDEFDFTVFCRKRYCDIVTKEYKGVRIVHIPSINTKHLDALTYTIFATVVASLRGYDVFWFQALGPAITMCVPRLLGKKVVSTVHGLDWKRKKFGKIASSVLKVGEKSIARFADRIIVLNRADYVYFKETYGRECDLIQNGVERHERIGANLIKYQFGLHGYDYFLFMSRIVPEKNVCELIEAYKLVETDKKLVIAGRGVHTSEYEKKARLAASEDSRVLFVGHVRGIIREELYSNACAYILPSTVEGQSIGLLEALSYRLPCIVSNIPENMEVIGDTQLAFKSNDIEELAERIAFVDQHPDKVQLDDSFFSQIMDEHTPLETIKKTIETLR